MLAAEDLARAGGSEVVFSDIGAQHLPGCRGFDVAGFDDEVQVPLAVTKHQFPLLRCTPFEDAALVFAKAHGNGDPSAEGNQQFEDLGANGSKRVFAYAIIEL